MGPVEQAAIVGGGRGAEAPIEAGGEEGPGEHVAGQRAPPGVREVRRQIEARIAT